MIYSDSIPPRWLPLLEIAKLYGELGIHTFPIHEGPKVPPAGSHGHKEATTDPAEFRKLLRRFLPHHQVGIAARMGDPLPDGRYSVCLDIDEKNGKSGSATLQRFGLLIPETLTAITRSLGRHYLLGSEVPLRSTAGLLSGVDVVAASRSPRWIVVQPTPGYRWLAEDGPQLHLIAMAPEWLLEITERAGREKQPKSLPDGSTRTLVPCWAHQDTNPSLQIVTLPDGRRLYHCFAGCSFEDIAAADPELIELTEVFR